MTKPFVTRRLEWKIDELKAKLRAADAMANAIDELVRRKMLGSRSIAADARLDYGDPWTYKFNDAVPFSRD
jgi:multidrug resistance efflux pump